MPRPLISCYYWKPYSYPILVPSGSKISTKNIRPTRCGKQLNVCNKFNTGSLQRRSVVIKTAQQRAQMCLDFRLTSLVFNPLVCRGASLRGEPKVTTESPVETFATRFSEN